MSTTETQAGQDERRQHPPSAADLLRRASAGGSVLPADGGEIAALAKQVLAEYDEQRATLTVIRMIATEATTDDADLLRRAILDQFDPARATDGEVTATWDEVVAWQRGQVRVPLALDNGADAVLVMSERTAEALVEQLQAVALGDGSQAQGTDGPREARISPWTLLGVDPEFTGRHDEENALKRLLDDVAVYLAATHRHAGLHDSLGAGLACAGCALLAQIEGAIEPHPTTMKAGD